MSVTPRLYSRPYPALKMLIVVLSGILLSFSLQFNALLLITLCCSSLLLCVGAFFAQRLRMPAYLVALVLSGYYAGVQLSEQRIETASPYPPGINALVIGKVTQIMPFDSTYFRCVVDGNVDLNNQEVHNATVLLSIGSYPHISNIHIGSFVYCIARLRAPQPQYLPTEFSESQYCAAMGIRWIGQVYVNEIALCGEQKSYRQTIEEIRTDVESTVDELYPPETRGFVKALLLGDKRDISLERRQRFALTGTAHVLAVSGLHVGIIALILFSLTAFISAPWLRWLLLAGCLFAFVALSGMQPSAVRASIMALVIFGLKIFQREASMLNVLAAVVMGMILLQPSLLYSAGFQMSVASILGIALFNMPYSKLLSRINPKKWAWLEYGTQGIAISLAAGTTVAPIVAWYFSLYSAVSPLANLVVIPLTTLAMISSLMSIVLAPLSHTLALFYAQFTHGVLVFSESCNTAFSYLPLSSVHSMQAMFLACILSIATAYVFTSRSLRCAVFRLFLSSVIAVMVLLIILTPVQKEEYWERKKYTLHLIPLTPLRKAVILRDKARYIQSDDDYAAEQYLSMSEADSLVVVPFGRVSTTVADSMASHLKGKKIEVLRASTAQFY